MDMPPFLLGSVAAVLGLRRERSRNYLVHLSPWRVKIMTPRRYMLWLALRGSSSGWEMVSTCLLSLLISG